MRKPGTKKNPCGGCDQYPCACPDDFPRVLDFEPEAGSKKGIVIVARDGSYEQCPRRSDYVDPIQWLRAYYDFSDRVTTLNNEAFDRAFRRDLGSNRRPKA